MPHSGVMLQSIERVHNEEIRRKSVYFRCHVFFFTLIPFLMTQFPEAFMDIVSPATRDFLRSTGESDAVVAESNQVVVSPGGAVFTSIQAAIDSITDASQQKQYALFVGPGTYNEVVTLKPWIYIDGAGQDGQGNNYTIISAPGGNSDTSATVTGASNSGLSSVTVESTYAPGALMNACIDCTGAEDFSCFGVIAIAYDSASTACTMLPVVNNRGNLNPNVACRVAMFDCVLTAQAQNPRSFAIALWSVENGAYQVAQSTLTATGNYVAVGGCGNPGAGSTLIFQECAITGTQYSLQTGTGSTVVAMGCTLNGPVGPGVVIK